MSRAGGPQYVFVHGLGGDKNIFVPAFEHPQAGGKSLLSVDLLGFGTSSRLEGRTPYTFALQTEALVEVLRQARIKRFNLVLHSMSSALLPELLAHDELEIPQIFLLEANLLEEDGDWSRDLYKMTEAEYSVYFQKIQKASRFVMASQLRRSHPRQRVEEWSRCFVQADARALRETAIRLYERTCSGEIVEALRKYRGRSVYFRGIDRRQWDGQELLAQLGIELVEIERAGHHLMLDDPETVYGMVFSGQPAIGAGVNGFSKISAIM
ncbi:MAG: alpha/beta hydrolase [Chloroflexi bacterium]|nr:alpha/beta hydrolase [Chloroflexota bacterium]